MDGFRCGRRTSTYTLIGFPLSVMIVFVGHVIQLWVHGDSHQLLLHIRVLTNVPLVETTKQHDLLLVRKSAVNISSAFLKS